MESSLTRLEGTLRDEIRAYTALVNRLPFKLALIKKQRIEQLERMVSQEEEELRQLAELELGRAATVRELCHLLPGVEPRLAALLPHLPAARRATLTELGDSLVALTRRLREGHAEVAARLRTCLEVIDFTMDMVGQAVANAQPATYGGSPGAYAPSILLDRRA